MIVKLLTTISAFIAQCNRKSEEASVMDSSSLICKLVKCSTRVFAFRATTQQHFVSFSLSYVCLKFPKYDFLFLLLVLFLLLCLVVVVLLFRVCVCVCVCVVCVCRLWLNVVVEWHEFFSGNVNSWM